MADNEGPVRELRYAAGVTADGKRCGFMSFPGPRSLVLMFSVEGGPGLEITLDVENAANLHDQVGTVLRDLVS
jgi:hypothetical protein